MERRTYNMHRIFAGLLLLLLVIAAASYYLDLELFGRFDKGVLLVALGIIIVYGSFFSPTREDIREHRRSSAGQAR